MPTFNHKGCELFYEVRGVGEPLLFLHGLGSCSEDWAPQVQAFENDYQVILCDLRGHGKTGIAKPPYNIPQFAADIKALLDHLNVDSCHIVGLSLGGMNAFQLAVEHPEACKSLTIVNSTPYVCLSGLKEHFMWYSRLGIIHFLGMESFGRFLAGKLFPKPEHESQRETVVQNYASLDKKTYLNIFRSLKGWDVRDRLSRIDCPTQVVCSDKDYTDVEFKREYLALINNAELVVIPDAYHAVTAEKPIEFNSILSSFLLSHRSVKAA